MGKQYKVKIGGNFSFDKLPSEAKENIKVMLAGKDHVLKMGKAGILPGIKIDGKEVGKHNIHKFEKKNRLPELKKLKAEMKAKKPKVVAAKAKPKKSKLDKVVSAVKDKVVGAKEEIDTKLHPLKPEPGQYYSLNDLVNIKGIGKKTVAELKKLYKSVDDLKKALDSDLIYDKLRDDVVDVLKEELI